MSEKKLPFEFDQQAPPYEEESTPPPTFSDLNHPPRPSLHAQRTETRIRRIQNLLTSEIEPLLYSDLLAGISQRILLLIPSDILTQQPNLSATDIVSGLPNHASNNSNAHVRLIRLHGPENHAAFWHQLSVLTELASSLRARLAASGHQVESPLETAPRPPAPLPPTPRTLDPQPSSSSSPSWFKKPFTTTSSTTSSPPPNQQPYDPTASTNFKLGWREDENADAHRHLLAPRRATPSRRMKCAYGSSCATCRSAWRR